MNEHLRFIGREAGPDVHVVLVLDQVGWHVAKALEVPANVTLLHLPPYSPELNGAERICCFLRSHYLSNRVYKDEIFEAIRAAWNRLDADRLKTLTRAEWIERARLNPDAYHTPGLRQPGLGSAGTRPQHSPEADRQEARIRPRLFIAISYWGGD